MFAKKSVKQKFFHLMRKITAFALAVSMGAGSAAFLPERDFTGGKASAAEEANDEITITFETAPAQTTVSEEDERATLIAAEEAAGRYVLEGTIYCLDYDGLLKLQGKEDPNPDSTYGKDKTYTVLVLKESQSLAFMSGDGDGMRAKETALISITDFKEGEELDGTEAILSLDPSDYYWPSDTSLPLGQPSGSGYKLLSPAVSEKKVPEEPVDQVDLTDESEEEFVYPIELPVYGSASAAYVTSDGSLYLWGDDTFRTGDHYAYEVFEKELGFAVKDVDIYGNNGICLSEDGTLYTWGNNDYGLQGIGKEKAENVHDAGSQDEPEAYENGGYPLHQVELPDTPVQVMLSSSGTAACITENGQLYMWGSNYGGVLGMEPDDAFDFSSLPVQIPIDGKAEEVYVGTGLASCITEDGRLFLWGDNSNGSIGNGSGEWGEIVTEPYEVVLPDGEAVSEVRFIAGTVFCLTESGKVYAWGYSYTWKLGYEPEEISDGLTFTDIEVTGSDFAGITDTGDLYVMGYNDHGQLGDGTTENAWELQLVPMEGRVVQVCVSDAVVVCLTKEGEVYTWGSTIYHNSTPQQIPIDGKVIAIKDCYAMTEDGILYGWDDCFGGELKKPVELLTDEGFVSGLPRTESGEEREGAPYQITFELNGGQFEDPSVLLTVQPTDEEGFVDFALYRPVYQPNKAGYSGYTFKGWYTSPDFSGSPVNVDTRFTSDTTLYAKWERVFTLGYDNNGFAHTAAGLAFLFHNSTYSLTDYLPTEAEAKAFFQGASEEEMQYALEHYYEALNWTEPGGVCYGIARLIALVYNGDLTLEDISDGGADSFYDLDPASDPRLFKNIFCNWLLSSKKIRYKYEDTVEIERPVFGTIGEEEGLPEFLSQLIGLSQTGKAFILTFDYTNIADDKSGAHILVIYGGYAAPSRNCYVLTGYDVNSSNSSVGDIGDVVEFEITMGEESGYVGFSFTDAENVTFTESRTDCRIDLLGYVDVDNSYIAVIPAETK